MYMCFEDKKLVFTDNHGQWHFRSYNLYPLLHYFS